MFSFCQIRPSTKTTPYRATTTPTISIGIMYCIGRPQNTITTTFPTYPPMNCNYVPLTYHVLELYIVLCFVAVQPQLTSYLYPQPPTPQPHLTNTTYPLHIGIMYYIMFSFCHYINQPKLTITPLKYWNYVLCQIRPCFFSGQPS